MPTRGGWRPVISAVREEVHIERIRQRSLRGVAIHRTFAAAFGLAAVAGGGGFAVELRERVGIRGGRQRAQQLGDHPHAPRRVSGGHLTPPETRLHATERLTDDSVR